MRSKVVRIAVAVVLALVGTVVLVRYVESARDEAIAGEGVVAVYVVDEAVPRGTPGNQLEGKVHREEVPAKVRAEGAITDLATVAKLSTGVALVPGEQLVASRFVSAGEAARGEQPEGTYSITIDLDAERALGGRVRAGDRVAVIVTYGGGDASKTGTEIAVPDAYVSGVRGEVPDSGGGADGVRPLSSGTYSVDLALTSDDLLTIVRAKEQGKLWLSALPEGDVDGGGAS